MLDILGFLLLPPILHGLQVSHFLCIAFAGLGHRKFFAALVILFKAGCLLTRLQRFCLNISVWIVAFCIPCTPPVSKRAVFARVVPLSLGALDPCFRFHENDPYFFVDVFIQYLF